MPAEKRTKARVTAATGLAKALTGIQGLDEITGGGLPRGRPTLICGTAGCGKTLMALEFLLRGAIQFNEPGVFVAFEESAEELTANMRSLGFDLDTMVSRKQLLLDHVRVERSDIEESGEYNLDGLFVRLAYAIDSIGAKRVVLDTIEALFSSFSNAAILRAELRRLFGWLKDKQVTAIITGERGEGQLTRQGLEEYVSDCVILLDHRVSEQLSTRRLRIVKYRGSSHGTNEYPFLIDEQGISVLPITSARLDHAVSDERAPSGIPALDEMLGGDGFYRGSSILLSGTAGTGKTSIASHVAAAACRRGERCLYLSFEESPAQIIRNMRSIGLDLEPWVTKGRLHIHATRPSMHGLEMHLVSIHKLIRDQAPRLVIIDPVTNLMTTGSSSETLSMLVRLIDFLKSRQITALLLSLTAPEASLEQTDVGISSIIDTWLLLRDIELHGERNRAIYVLKSRGMAHSNQVREFLLTKRGIELREVYLGPTGMLTGSARLAQELREREQEAERQQEVERQQAALAARRKSLEAQVAALKAEIESVGSELRRVSSEEKLRSNRHDRHLIELARSRGAAARSRHAGGTSHDE